MYENEARELIETCTGKLNHLVLNIKGDINSEFMAVILQAFSAVESLTITNDSPLDESRD
jgi:hypothetical protein